MIVEEAAREYCKKNFPYSEHLHLTMSTAFEAGAEWQARKLSWVRTEERLPEVKGEKPKLFIIALRVEYDGKIYYPTTIAMIQNHESQEGFAYTPKNKFFWGPDIFEEVFAWMPIPSFDEILEANKDVLQRLKDK